MRIALDATYSVDPFPSGIAVYSRELITALAQLHPADRFICCYRPKQWLRPDPIQRPNILRAPLLSPLKTFRAGIFHALNQRLDSRPAPHVVCTFHDLFVMTEEYSSPDFRLRFTAQARAAAHRSDIIIAVSEFTAEQVQTLLNFPRERIRVIPHGVRIPAEVSSTRREKIVLFLGALQKRKNLIRLVNAFARMPDDWLLLLAGGSGYGVEEILDAVERSPARSRIQLLGYVSDARRSDLLSRASIFAFPSLDEGFGIPILEAMAHGIPVLTSNRSATAEVAGDAALMVDPASDAEIESGLQILARDEDLRTELVARGRRRAAEFTWERAAQRTYDVYRELSADLLRLKS